LCLLSPSISLDDVKFDSELSILIVLYLTVFVTAFSAIRNDPTDPVCH
jgi:hypothetical protein